ncbi:MAG: hypothetical protein WBO43_09820 [Gemmatimonadota bacterium]
MGHECEMGFSDLFRLARKRAWTSDEEDTFKALEQDARNEAVRQLAQESGCVRTENRRGTDGVIYTAFWLEGPVES